MSSPEKKATDWESTVRSVLEMLGKRKISPEQAEDWFAHLADYADADAELSALILHL